MTAPLRKVIRRDMVQVGSRMSQSRGTLTVRNYFDVVYALECGHRLIVPSTKDRQADAKRCKACAAQASKMGTAGNVST